ncbi:hypothetical protein BV308_26730, partial [Klebsiella pneumoniae]
YLQQCPILLTGYLSSSQVISLVHYIVQAGVKPWHGVCRNTDVHITTAQLREKKGNDKGRPNVCSSVNRTLRMEISSEDIISMSEDL